MAGNNLIHETSPYLLQHADNPVDWYGWNDEALKKAKDENKPIFLSIGYSALYPILRKIGLFSSFAFFSASSFHPYQSTGLSAC